MRYKVIQHKSIIVKHAKPPHEYGTAPFVVAVRCPLLNVCPFALAIALSAGLPASTSVSRA